MKKVLPCTSLLILIFLTRMEAQESLRPKFNQGIAEKEETHTNIFGREDGKIYTITRTSRYASREHYKLFTMHMYNAVTLTSEKDIEIGLDDLPGIELEQIGNGNQEFGKEYKAIISKGKILFFYWDRHEIDGGPVKVKYMLFLKQFDMKTLAQIGKTEKLMESSINNEKQQNTLVNSVRNSFQYWHYRFSPDSSWIELGMMKSFNTKGVNFCAFAAFDLKNLKLNPAGDIPGKGAGYTIWDAVVTNQGKQYAIMGQYGKDKSGNFGLINMGLIDFANGAKVLPLSQENCIYKSANLLVGTDNKLYAGGTCFKGGKQEKIGSFFLAISDEGFVNKAAYNEFSAADISNMSKKDYENNRAPGDKYFRTEAPVCSGNNLYFITQPFSITEDGGGQDWIYKSYVIASYDMTGALRYQRLIPNANKYFREDRFFAKGSNLQFFNTECKANTKLDLNNFDEGDVNKREYHDISSSVTIDEKGVAKRTLLEDGKLAACFRGGEYYFLKSEKKKIYLGYIKL
jgi:hypothetical protein